MKRSLLGTIAALLATSALATDCIPSGVTDQFTYFVAVDATDFVTRETGLNTFTVYRSRNGGASVAYTTPTINETDATNQPGVYELLLDEDMAIDAGDDVQHMVVTISHAGMARVTKEFCIARPKITVGNTLGVASDGDMSGNVEGTVVGLGTFPNLGSGATLAGNLEDMRDNGTAAYDRATDSLQAIRDRGDAAWVTGASSNDPSLQVTTVASVTSQTILVPTATPTFVDQINGWGVYIEDAGDADAYHLTYVTNYDQTNGQVTIAEAAPFTVAASDTMVFLPSFMDLGVDVSSWNGVSLSSTNPLPNAAPASNGGLPTVNASNQVAGVAALRQLGRADATVLSCEVNTANFAGSTTTVACILTDRDGGAVSVASNDLEGRELLILSGAQLYEGRFINDTTWDAVNSEVRLTLSRALPATLADAVTAIIR